MELDERRVRDVLDSTLLADAEPSGGPERWLELTDPLLDPVVPRDGVEE
ncbi:MULTISPECIES: hypothetical protein [unclassified Streptomyces]|nr:MULTISPECIES: hypothetical protein [unclassified Streptomyces]WSA91689.1 hypothetical protein OIE63_09050 [Streptomyces sp. NBC_01795]WSB76063.1 hypothetical protein OHB04_09860 [Streptomyces sp. NBC_01775]WSS15664.1 hypothetical protein OG533_30070 [Streptomyces sp. NBC_01186]WSS44506.1 hypothetical protein OG220_30870 [Streptomyces sp. NBC_01187]